VVLVIDDDADARLLLARLIEEMGWRVVSVGSGEEGVRHAHELMPDLILLDLLMPEMDGLAFLDALRADARLAHLPVVVLTGKDLTEGEVALLRRRADLVLRKADEWSASLGRVLAAHLRSVATPGPSAA
jgi:CheY-like chemotaxis protein